MRQYLEGVKRFNQRSCVLWGHEYINISNYATYQVRDLIGQCVVSRPEPQTDLPTQRLVFNFQ